MKKDWKKIAKTLAKAIVRFEKDDWACNVSDNASNLARKVAYNKNYK
jgi:hypothetical protein